MKNLITLRGILLRLVTPAIALGVMINLASCSKTETNKPAPSVTVTPTTTSNLAGLAVATSVQVDAPEGGQTLNILVNGTANSTLPNVTLDGSASQTVPVSFTIPAAAAVGSNYVITFQAVDKKNQLSPVGVFVATVSATAAKVVVTKTGTITANETWTSDKIYLLDGFVRVGVDVKPGGSTAVQAPVVGTTAVLTIQPGTVIYGKTAAGQPGGALIVQRGSQIIANGTASQPIIFTSQKAIGFKRPGDWGGLVICGRAQNNVGNPANPSTSTATAQIEELEGSYQGYHGGGAASNDADNSGSLKYVRIEYAGYPINPNQEINGLTLGSVGSATTMSYIQVTYANDDSFEWFGGAVNADHLIAYKGIDDDFDTDNGYRGYVQFGIALRDATIADQSGSNGFECDNDANGTANTPITGAKFSNMSIIGGKATSGTTLNSQFQNCAQIRRNAQQDIYNSFMTAFPNGIYLDGQLPANTPPDGTLGVVANATAGSVEFKNNILAGVEGWGGNGFGRPASAPEQLNVTVPLTAGLTNYDYNTKNWLPNNEFVGAGTSTVPPRGRAVFAGAGSFVSGVFQLNTPSGSNPAFVEINIAGVHALTWFKQNNEFLSRWSDAGINANVFDPLSGTPTFTVTGKLATGADFTGLTVGTGSPSTGFVSVAYRGAFGSTDWTTGWTNWNPQALDYSH